MTDCEDRQTDLFRKQSRAVGCLDRVLGDRKLFLTCTESVAADSGVRVSSIMTISESVSLSKNGKLSLFRSAMLLSFLLLDSYRDDVAEHVDDVLQPAEKYFGKYRNDHQLIRL